MTDPAQAERLAHRYASVGYGQLKAFSLLTPDNLRALCRASPLPVTANCPNAMTFEEAVETGVHCLDQLHNVARGHMRSDAPVPEFWDRFDPVPGTRLDFAAIRRLARFLAERKVWNVPTLVFHQRDAVSPEEGMRDPALKYVRVCGTPSSRMSKSSALRSARSLPLRSITVTVTSTTSIPDLYAAPARAGWLPCAAGPSLQTASSRSARATIAARCIRVV